MENLPKVCVLCSHFRCDYDSGFSEFTPGSGFIMYCRKHHFDVRGWDMDDEHSFRAIILKAETCPDFKIFNKD